MSEQTTTEVGVIQLDDTANPYAVASEGITVDLQVATAKKFPRSIEHAIKNAIFAATMDRETAETMFYALPRGGRKIMGPSARLAEIMLQNWGNIRADAEIVEVGKKTVTAMATAFDVERNVAVRIKVERRITDRRGKRYDDDMILVTSNAAVSIALRNAVLKVIPSIYTTKVYRAAQEAAAGDTSTMEARRSGAVSWFSERGVEPEALYRVIGVKGLEDIGSEELITLLGLAQAIKQGETSIEQVFRPSAKESAATDELNDALG